MTERFGRGIVLGTDPDALSATIRMPTVQEVRAFGSGRDVVLAPLLHLAPMALVQDVIVPDVSRVWVETRGEMHEVGVLRGGSFVAMQGEQLEGTLQFVAPCEGDVPARRRAHAAVRRVL